MTPAPEVVVFDVNETLSDMTPLATRFADVGAPAHLADTWFASVLREGFGLAAAGTSATFREIAVGVLGPMLTDAGVDDVGAATEHVLAGFGALEVHPDVPEGVRAMSDAGLRLVTLTNGAVAGTEALLGRAGVRDRFERLMSVEDAGVWKPAPGAYAHAVTATGVPAERLLMVAVHPWDLHGASRAGLRTAWVDRSGSPYPSHLPPPDLHARSMVDLAEQLRAS